MSWREQLDVGELTVSRLIVKDPSELGETVFMDVQADDLATAFQVSGDVDTGLNITGAVTDGIVISGGGVNAIELSGAYTTHAINLDGVTLSTTLIGAGSYSSPMVQTCTTGFASWSGTKATADSWQYAMGLYPKATGSGTKNLGINVQAEYNGTDGADRLQAGSFIAYLGGGGEAARLLTLGGDAVAGMYAIWAKVTAPVAGVVDSGSRVAAIWVDNQMNCDCNGEEYSMFITTGGSRPDAVFGFKTSSSSTPGHDFLFLWDSTYTGGSTKPLDGGSVATQSGASDGSIRCKIGSTVVLIPYFNE